MTPPIFTIIRNKRDTSRTIYFAGKDSKWLAANSDLIVPFEVWTLAEDYQKEAIKAELKNGNIELIICVTSTDGKVVQVPFEPVAKTAVPGPATKYAPKPMDTTKEQVAELDHTVKVTSHETAAVLEGMGAKKIGFEDEVLPARELKNGEPEPKNEDVKEAEATVDKEATAEQPAKKTRSKKS